jgi:hypothetical protein
MPADPSLRAPQNRFGRAQILRSVVSSGLGVVFARGARIAQPAAVRQAVPAPETGRDLRFHRPSVVDMTSMTKLVARLAIDLMRTHSATCC